MRGEHVHTFCALGDDPETWNRSGHARPGCAQASDQHSRLDAPYLGDHLRILWRRNGKAILTRGSSTIAILASIAQLAHRSSHRLEQQRLHHGVGQHLGRFRRKLDESPWVDHRAWSAVLAPSPDGKLVAAAKSFHCCGPDDTYSIYLLDAVPPIEPPKQ